MFDLIRRKHYPDLKELYRQLLKFKELSRKVTKTQGIMEEHNKTRAKSEKLKTL